MESIEAEKYYNLQENGLIIVTDTSRNEGSDKQVLKLIKLSEKDKKLLGSEWDPEEPGTYQYGDIIAIDEHGGWDLLENYACVEAYIKV